MILFHTFAANIRQNMQMRMFCLSLFAAIFAFGSVGSAQSLSSKPGRTVVLRGLDKVTAITHDFEVEIGKPKTFGSMTIKLSYCRKRPPEEVPEVFALLTITDRKTDGSGNEIEAEPIFNGWMFASSPALNSLEHPVYDVWVLDCK